MERSVIDGTPQVSAATAAGPAEEASRELAGVLKLDESKVRGHLDEVVRSTVEQTLNELLDVTCPPKTEPGVMRVPMTPGRGWQETLEDETHTTFTGSDHQQAS